MYSKYVSLNFKKKIGIYSNSTGSLTFNPKTCEAYSYRWWKFVAIVENKVVFNNYRYSVSTSKHQSKIEGLLEELGIKIDLKIPLSKGINSTSLNDLILEAEESLCNQFLEEQVKKQERYQRAKIKKALLKSLISQGFDASYADRYSQGVKVRCSQCQAQTINNFPIHEQGCPNIPKEVTNE